MLKNMAERETKEFQDVQRKQDMELRNRNDTNLALRLQMKEKKDKRQMDRNHD